MRELGEGRGSSQKNLVVGWMTWRDTKQRPSGHVGPLPLCKKVKAQFGRMCQGCRDPVRPPVQLFQGAPGAGHVVGSLSQTYGGNLSREE